MNGARSHRHRGNRRLLIGFLICVVSVTFFVLRNPTRTPNAIEEKKQGLETLTESAAKESVEAFLAKKESLRREIARSLQTSGPGSKEYQIAVYLFPSLLPESDFERTAGLDLWAPLQEAIEKEPRTEASRQRFDDLRTLVWNYENPDRSEPVVSDAAQGMIRIYDALSEVKGGSGEE